MRVYKKMWHNTESIGTQRLEQLQNAVVHLAAQWGILMFFIEKQKKYSIIIAMYFNIWFIMEINLLT